MLFYTGQAIAQTFTQQITEIRAKQTTLEDRIEALDKRLIIIETKQTFQNTIGVGLAGGIGMLLLERGADMVFGNKRREGRR